MIRARWGICLIAAGAAIGACNSLTGVNSLTVENAGAGGAGGSAGAANSGGNAGDAMSDGQPQGGQDASHVDAAADTPEEANCSGVDAGQVCDECIAQNCCAEFATCVKNTDCANAMMCAKYCDAGTPIACETQCVPTVNGRHEFLNYMGCMFVGDTAKCLLACSHHADAGP